MQKSQTHTDRHVILFARPPRYGCVKTRLARDIGKRETLRFYRNNLTRILRRLKSIPSINTTVAITPGYDLSNGVGPHFLDNLLAPQSKGDLGTKMARALDHNASGPTVIIGSDIPDVSRETLDEAFHALATNDAVFGPCDDGGYWLIGLKRMRKAPSGFLKNVDWSTPKALEQSCASLPKTMKVAYISVLDDIDDGASLDAWKRKSVERKGFRWEL